jgi:hypothetical protein
MRVLSLDGGGSWALLQVQALMDLFPQAATGHDVLRQFDYAAANSGGTIVLAGLIEDLPLTKVRDFFFEETARRQVFSLLPWWKRLLPRFIGIGPRYDVKAKLAGLGGRMPITGPQLITALGAHVERSTGRQFDFLLATFDYDRCRGVLQRSDSDSPTASGAAPHVPTLVQAVHAATNAPVNYFNRPARFDLYDGNLPQPGPRRRRFWDGAIGGYNNPALAALVEIMARPNPPLASEVSILSLGTGTVSLPLGKYYPGAPDLLVHRLPKEGLLHDIKTVATAIMDDPPDAASFIAHVWTGGRMPAGRETVQDGKLVRLNPLVQPVRDKSGALALPAGLDEKQFARLSTMDSDAVAQEDVDLVHHLGELWLADGVANQPLRANGLTLEAEIGFGRYTAAKRAWLARNPWR